MTDTCCLKKELQTANLLKQIQMGFNPKTKKNEPNRLYLSKLDVKATDVYLRGEYGQKKPDFDSKTTEKNNTDKLNLSGSFVRRLIIF